MSYKYSFKATSKEISYARIAQECDQDDIKVMFLGFEPRGGVVRSLAMVHEDLVTKEMFSRFPSFTMLEPVANPVGVEIKHSRPPIGNIAPYIAFVVSNSSEKADLLAMVDEKACSKKFTVTVECFDQFGEAKHGKKDECGAYRA